MSVQSRQRELIAMVTNLGLTIQDQYLKDGAKLVMVLLGPDGVTISDKLVFNLNATNHHALLNDEMQIKRFARRFEQPKQEPKWQAQPEKVGVVAAALSKALETAKKPEPQQPQPQPKKELTVTPHDPNKRLTNQEVAKLSVWISNNVAQDAKTTPAHLAQEAAKALGFTVSPASVERVLEALEIKLYVPENQSTDRAWIIAAELHRLMAELNFTPSTAFMAVVNRQAQPKGN